MSKQSKCAKQFDHEKQYESAKQFERTEQEGNAKQLDCAGQEGNAKQPDCTEQEGNAKQLDCTEQEGNAKQLDCTEQDESAKQYERAKMIYGDDAIDRLSAKRVAVFGIGGVGGNAVEALARSGIGTIDIIDNDTVDITNINRQTLAYHSTVGLPKVDVMEARIHDIDPNITVNKHRMFYLPNTPEADSFDFSAYDYIIDAIDTVTGKIGIIQSAHAASVPVISCMGCGNRTDPTKLTVCDIYETNTDPLARIMRKKLRSLNIESLTVVYSTEPVVRKKHDSEPNESNTPTNKKSVLKNEPTRRKDTPGSTAFVPPAAGLIAASIVVNELVACNG